ncbi:O-antigen ligase domain-containing protein [Rhodobaculum claviforme]|uniref:Capsular biosynthesis protein n=1 Tax=Rhodobaculum claviforme TaxID=1549854 RepID=A0A934TIH3_9RHOB|nr:O-antigen ligase domain-containing protein [Rhodobaculum claviforme]MBK5926136.1 capsular biosynthesis protein [Rhodobaculum claviforme]
MVWHALVWTWPLYLVGALYVLGPVLGWLIGALAALSLYLGPAIRADLRATGPVPGLVWLWGAGMAVMLVALWVGHLDWGFGTGAIIKSSIGWAKGWALIVLFLLAGAVLPIRRRLLVRAQSVLGLTTLIATPVLVLGYAAGLPEQLFVSPLRAVGGPGPEYFGVYLFTYDPSSWTPRWQFFAPWSPFAALLGVIMVLFALEEDNTRLRAIAIAAGVAMILLSKSRMGLVGLVACTMIPRLMPLMLRGWAWTVLAGVAASMAVLGGVLIAVIQGAIAGFRGARADSTRVRETLQRIAAERWQSDAFWWGHGTVQPGPHLVEYMPIGSHHTWWGLLFVKGVVGFMAFLVPFALHGLRVAADAVVHPRGRLPLGLMLTFLLLSFGENIEIQVYLLWPALVLLGIHLREMAQPRDPGGPRPRAEA